MVYFDIELLGISLPAMGFLIASLLMFKNARTMREIKETYITNLYFAIGFILQAIGYSFWIYRLLIYPPYIRNFMAEYTSIEYMFKLAYTFAGLGIPFITFFGVLLTKGLDFFKKFKWLYILPWIGFIILFYLIYFVISLEPVYYSANSTLDFTFNLRDPTGLFVGLYILILLIIPDSAFIYYLNKIGRKQPHFKRVLIITIGLIIYFHFYDIRGRKIYTTYNFLC